MRLALVLLAALGAPAGLPDWRTLPGASDLSAPALGEVPTAHRAPGPSAESTGRPLSESLAVAQTERRPAPLDPVWLSLPDALDCAARERRPVPVYVHVDWCAPCRRMERETFPLVAPLLGRFDPAGLEFDDDGTDVTWNTPFWPSVVQVVLGGALVIASGIFIGSA